MWLCGFREVGRPFETSPYLIRVVVRVIGRATDPVPGAALVSLSVLEIERMTPDLILRNIARALDVAGEDPVGPVLLGNCIRDLDQVLLAPIVLVL